MIVCDSYPANSVCIMLRMTSMMMNSKMKKKRRRKRKSEALLFSLVFVEPLQSLKGPIYGTFGGNLAVCKSIPMPCGAS